MQIQVNLKNVLILCVGLFFLYLAYLLCFADSVSSSKLLLPAHISVSIRDVVSYCVLAAEIGGSAIVKVHNGKSFWKRTKSKTDVGVDEFVTNADIISHQLILESLKRAPGLNIISEEKASIDDEIIEPYRENNYFRWQKSKDLVTNLPENDRYLLSDLLVYVDPLDATQEFSEDLLQYVTVMLCVTVRGKPIAGIIHRPFFNETVIGLVNHGIYPENYVRKRPSSEKSQKVVIVSRSHGGKVKALLSDAFAVDADRFRIESAGGSGFKSLRLINGTADFYMHITQLKKWDACAPDAVIRAAGGRVTDLDGMDINYSADRDDLLMLRNGFLASMNNHVHFLAKFRRFLPENNTKV